ncbi:MAG: hypothetical protein HY075_07720 [Deltaproteobacteria bacterium]|nr:hypothetical protein [Deltaproteobacteria bacterium]
MKKFMFSVLSVSLVSLAAIATTGVPAFADQLPADKTCCPGKCDDDAKWKDVKCSDQGDKKSECEAAQARLKSLDKSKAE